MTNYTETLKGLKDISDTFFAIGTSPINANNISIQIAYDKGWVKTIDDAAAAIEALEAEVKRLQGKLCDWCAVCPKERRNPDDCELLGENPVMYGPSGSWTVRRE